MKKQLLLLAGALFILKTFSFGQACTPDPQYTNTNTQRGIYPDTITNFAAACVGTPYSQLVTIVIPADTNSGPPLFITFTWDSTVMASVTGLPASLSYACWNNSSKPNLCTWNGNSIGCAIITGTPATADIGTHNLVFNTNNYLRGYGNKTAAVTGYKIVVSVCTGVDENPNVQELIQNNPNPFSDKTEIYFTAEENGTAEFKIFDMLGTQVYHSSVKAKSGLNKIEVNAKDFNSGIYFYSIAHGNNAFTRKMVVNK